MDDLRDGQVERFNKKGTNFLSKQKKIGKTSAWGEEAKEDPEKIQTSKKTVIDSKLQGRNNNFQEKC